MQSPSTLLDPEFVTLRDGLPVTIRPIQPTDADHLQDAFNHLSMETIYLRFHAFKKELPDEEARYLATVDYDSRMAFVGLYQKDGRDIIIGVARYSLLDPMDHKLAESAVVVQDDYQGRGLGTLLLRRLVLYARLRGIHHLRGNLQVGNDRMLDLVKGSGLPYKSRYVGGVWQVDIDLALLENKT